jgi:hypothetical protein
VGCEVDRWRVCGHRYGRCRKVSVKSGSPLVVGRSGKVSGAIRGRVGRVDACGSPGRVKCR